MSEEHEVSLMSARQVLEAMDRSRFAVSVLVVAKDGQVNVGPDALEDQPVPADGPSNQHFAHLPAALSSSLGASLDIVFPLLHGPFGEDGTVQGLFELLRLPYVGSGVAGSALGMDKGLMKAAFTAAGLPQVSFELVTADRWRRAPQTVLDDLGRLALPLFVKPANLGSSVGISRVEQRDQLSAALNLSFTYDRRVVVEEGLVVRELEVAVLGNDQPEATWPGEIIPSSDYYDYEAKYIKGSPLQIPAPVTAQQGALMRQLAVQAFAAVDAAGLARVDFFIERATGRVLINEINTMPGFTQFSMYPQLWAHHGLSYRALLTRLIELGLERHQNVATRDKG